VALLEEQELLGGRAATTTIDDTEVDLGAAFISDFYTETMRLVEELGISSSLIRRSQTAYVIRQSRPRAIWPAPRLVGDHALPMFGKVRLMGLLPTLLRNWQSLDISDLSKIVDADHETAAEYARRTIGEEDTEFFFAPLLRGLLYWDPETTSAAVVWCILKAFVGSKATYRFAGGMSDLVNALASNINVSCQASVTGIERTTDGGFIVKSSVQAEESLLDSRAVLCAVPAPAAARLTDWLPRDLHRFLESVTYSSTAILTYRVKADAADYPQGAYLFPTSSVTDLSSVNPLYHYVDTQQPGTNVGTDRLLNVYLSDQAARDYAELPDAELGDMTLKRVTETLKQSEWARGAELAHVKRWQGAIPRFNVGHIKNVQSFSAQLPTLVPGLAFAGDYIGGPYIDGAIRSGVQAAKSLLDYLSTGS
jgi:oxygen-dependent protoporphyrinogen oxidase